MVKFVLFRQNELFGAKTGSIWYKWLLFGLMGCVWSKLVTFDQMKSLWPNGLHLGK